MRSSYDLDEIRRLAGEYPITTATTSRIAATSSGSGARLGEPITPCDMPADITDERDPADITDPIDPTEPIEKAEPAAPIDPIENADPTDPIEASDPFEAMLSIDSSDHSDHFDSPIGRCAGLRA